MSYYLHKCATWSLCKYNLLKAKICRQTISLLYFNAYYFENRKHSFKHFNPEIIRKDNIYPNYSLIR